MTCQQSEDAIVEDTALNCILADDIVWTMLVLLRIQSDASLISNYLSTMLLSMLNKCWPEKVVSKSFQAGQQSMHWNKWDTAIY